MTGFGGRILRPLADPSSDASESSPSDMPRLRRIEPPTTGATGGNDRLAAQLQRASGLRRLAANAGSLFASDVVNRATTFVLYALVARHLGTFEFGQMSLALTIFYTFQILSVAGIKTLVAREVARDQRQVGGLLLHGSVVVLGTSVLAMLAIAALVRLMGYAPGTGTIVVLLSAGLIPFSLSQVTEAVFLGRERMVYVALANVPVNVLKIVLAYLLLTQGYGLETIVFLMLGSLCAVLAIDWWLLLGRISRSQLQFQFSAVVGMLRSTLTFLGIDGVIAITSSLNVLLLSYFTTETEIGYYSAATQVMVPVLLVYQSVVMAVFPAMCRRAEGRLADLRLISLRLIEILISISLPVGVGLAILARPTLALLYGEGTVVEGAVALRIMIAGVVVIALTHVLGQALIASRRERINLRIVLVDLVVSLIAGPILIWQFGFIGAAVTAVVVRAVDFALHYLPVARQFNGIPMLSLSWRPALATALMAVSLVIAGGHGLLLNVLLGGLVYLLSLGLLVVATIGGPERLRSRYVDLTSDVV